MKSQVNALLHVTEGILADAALVYPALKESFSKDWKRITLYSESKGLGFFSLDLPHLESLLLEGLETGCLRLEGPLSRVVSKEVRVPRLFAGLWLHIFQKDACLKHEVDVNAIFFLRSLLVIGKRIKQDCSDDRILAKVGEYHDIERKLRTPTLGWKYDEFLDHPSRQDHGVNPEVLSRGDCSHHGCDLRDPDLFPSTLPERAESEGLENDLEVAIRRKHINLPNLHLMQAVDYVYPGLNDPSNLFVTDNRREDEKKRNDDLRLLNRIQQVADLVFSELGPVDPVTLSGEWESAGLGHGFKHGPGAVAERIKNWDKSRFPNWPHKLEAVFPYQFCGSTAGYGEERPSHHEMASRLLCVPKTAKGPRLIAAEPTSHQWCQQLLLRFLFVKWRESFGTHFIDFKDQSKSGAMVLQASLDRRLATVDLSDASDRLSCWTVERMARSNLSLLSALHAARTRYILDEVTQKNVKNFLPLRKFASQGTATTFPIMSIVMLCIALGSTLSENEAVTMATLRKYRTRVRVFGDDIIVPSYGYARLVRAMELLELKVNTAKSYVHGRFRESCGTDGWGGYDVTPVKPETLVVDSPASCQAVVDTSNNLFNKGLWNAARSAEDLIPVQVRQYLRIVGRQGAGLRGLTSFGGSDERHLRKRWNHGLHRYEVRVWAIQAQVDKRQRNDVSGLLDFFTRSHSSVNPRIVSEYPDVRRTKARPVWEPENPDARTYP
nr:MAG: hypothetical protein 3 [Leviviridae sp.]